MHKLGWIMAASCLAAGCSTTPTDAPPRADPVTLRFTCTVSSASPKASYVGAYAGMENVVPAVDAARDMHCADAFKAGKYPRGFVTIFGSSRIKKDNKACDASGKCDETLRHNDQLYAAVRDFASSWTRRHGRTVPILTGAGPGLMEAGSEGAAEAGGPSIGYTTYYDGFEPPAPTGSVRPFVGDPAKAFNGFVSDGLIFTSIAQREAAMIRHSTAVVFAPGGTGTEWEIYQVIETIKSRQQSPMPVYFLGERATDWASLDARVKDLVARRVVRQDEIDPFLRFVATPAELVDRLGKDLALR